MKWEAPLRWPSPKRPIPGIGARVLALRRSHAMSIQVAATQAGMSLNRWRDLERHEIATIGTVTKVARLFGVEVDVLTGRKPETGVAT